MKRSTFFTITHSHQLRAQANQIYLSLHIGECLHPDQKLSVSYETNLDYVAMTALERKTGCLLLSAWAGVTQCYCGFSSALSERQLAGRFCCLLGRFSRAIFLQPLRTCQGLPSTAALPTSPVKEQLLFTLNAGSAALIRRVSIELDQSVFSVFCMARHELFLQATRRHISCRFR